MENDGVTAQWNAMQRKVSQAIAIQRLRREERAHPQLIADIEFNRVVLSSCAKARCIPLPLKSECLDDNADSSHMKKVNLERKQEENRKCSKLIAIYAEI